MNKTTLLLSLLLAAAGSASAQDPHLGRNLAATCANCHGTNGKSLGGIDSINGMEKARLLEKLEAFRSGAKPATIMHQISKGYTPAQLELIATYLAAQK